MSFPRYPAYKDSGVAWLKSIPSHWAIVQLRHLVDCLDGQRIPLNSAERSDRKGDVPYWGANSVQDYIDAHLFDEELVLLGEDGAPFFDKTKPVAFRSEGRIWPNNHIHVLRPRVKGDSAFLAYCLNATDFADYVDGSTRDKLTQSAMNRIAVTQPSEDERTAIVHFLDRETAKIDTLVAEQEQLISLLKEKRQAVISHAVTKGLDPSVPMKDSGVEWLGEVPAHWNVLPLKFLARIGNGSTPNRDNPNYWADEGFPWLNSSVVNQSEVSEAERFVTQAALDACHLPVIEPPAVLVGITGQGKTRGMAAPLAFTATVNQHLAYIKPNLARLSVEFLLRVLEAAYEHLRTESEGAGSTKGAITCGQLGAWFVPLPVQEEQSKIISFLDNELTKLDALTAEAEAGIELLRERRSALISAAVTGQIDVRGLAPALEQAA